jgi:hypothetical protein
VEREVLSGKGGTTRSNLHIESKISQLSILPLLLMLMAMATIAMAMVITTAIVTTMTKYYSDTHASN